MQSGLAFYNLNLLGCACYPLSSWSLFLEEQETKDTLTPRCPAPSLELHLSRGHTDKFKPLDWLELSSTFSFWSWLQQIHINIQIQLQLKLKFKLTSCFLSCFCWHLFQIWTYALWCVIGVVDAEWCSHMKEYNLIWCWCLKAPVTSIIHCHY